MKTEKILVIGACGRIGVELTIALRRIYGSDNVIASDVKAFRDVHPLLVGKGPYIPANVLDKITLERIVKDNKITQVYLLAAMLSVAGEKDPLGAWYPNMEALLNILEIARQEKLSKVFWPSSVAVFGLSSPKDNCPQEAIIEPTTAYGISKCAGENWCRYYHERFGVDVRSLRYPGLISYRSAPGGGTTDYAIEIFHDALTKGKYNCFLKEDTRLPMMYMPDAIRATIELMEAPVQSIRFRSSYNIAAISFSPAQIAAEIKKHIPDFEIKYQPDCRQKIADGWPGNIDDSCSREDWGWLPQYDLGALTADMLEQLGAVALISAAF